MYKVRWSLGFIANTNALKGRPQVSEQKQWFWYTHMGKWPTSCQSKHQCTTKEKAPQVCEQIQGCNLIHSLFGEVVKSGWDNGLSKQTTPPRWQGDAKPTSCQSRHQCTTKKKAPSVWTEKGFWYTHLKGRWWSQAKSKDCQGKQHHLGGEVKHQCTTRERAPKWVIDSLFGG